MKDTVTISIEEKTLQRIDFARGNVPRSRVFEEIIDRGLAAIGDESLILQEVQMTKTTNKAGASRIDRLTPHDTYNNNNAGRVHSV
jgi:hypothetical protein